MTSSTTPLIVFESEPVPLHADAVSELPEISHLDTVLQDQTALRQHVRGRMHHDMQHHEHQLRQQRKAAPPAPAAAAAAAASAPVPTPAAIAQLSTSSDVADDVPKAGAGRRVDNDTTAAAADDPTRYTENEETDSSSRRKRRHARFAANPVSGVAGGANAAAQFAAAVAPTLGERVRHFLSRNRYLIVAVVLVVAVLAVGALYYVRCLQEERLRALQTDRAGEARAEELLQRRQDDRLQALADEKALVERELDRQRRAAATMARTYEQQIAEQQEQQREQLEQMRRLQAYQQTQEERLQAYDELMRDYEEHLRAAEAHAGEKNDSGTAPDHERADATDAADDNEPRPASGIVSPKPVYATTGSASPTHLLVSGGGQAADEEVLHEDDAEAADTPSRSVPPWHNADDDHSDDDQNETTIADETPLQQAPPLGESGV